MKDLSNIVTGITALVSFLGGIVFALVTKLGEGGINEFYEERKRKKARRIEAAKNITSFCVEGMHKGFRIRAGSEHHIKFRAVEIEAINREIGVRLREFLSAWSFYRNFLKQRLQSAEEEKVAMEYKNKAQKLGEELLETAKDWANG